MRVADIMTSQPVTVSAGSSIEEALRLLQIHGFRHLPTLDRGNLVGILSDLGVLPYRQSGGEARRVERKQDKSSKKKSESPSSDSSPPMVQDVMSTPPVSIGPEEPSALAAWRMLEMKVGALCVTVAGGLIGIVTATDVIKDYAAGLGAPAKGRWVAEELDPKVRACMTRDLVVLEPDTPLDEAARLCYQAGVRHLPVVCDDSGRLLGMVAERELRSGLSAGYRRSSVGKASSKSSGDNTAVRETALTAILSSTLSVGADARLSEAAHLMVQGHTSVLPVTECAKNGDLTLIGVVTQTDVLKRCATSSKMSLVGDVA